MSSPLLASSAANIPLPGDPERARLGFERAASGPPVLQCLAGTSEGQALLAAIFGNSPFLSQLLHSDRDILEAFLTQEPAHVLADLTRWLSTQAEAAIESAALMRLLRRARRRAQLLIALADINGQWSLEQVTGALSDFAETALGLAVDHLLRRSAAAGDLNLPSLDNPSTGSGLVVLGMGKLGARELNYSS